MKTKPIPTVCKLVLAIVTGNVIAEPCSSRQSLPLCGEERLEPCEKVKLDDPPSVCGESFAARKATWINSSAIPQSTCQSANNPNISCSAHEAPCYNHESGDCVEYVASECYVKFEVGVGWKIVKPGVEGGQKWVIYNVRERILVGPETRGSGSEAFVEYESL